MVIKDLNKFLRSKCPQVFQIISLKTLSGYRVAIDANNYAYTRLAIAHSQVVGNTNVITSEPDRNQTINLWIQESIEFICKWLKSNITPIFVFDGKAPIEKKDTQTKRIKIRDKIKNDIEELKDEISSMSLDIDSTKVEELKKKMNQNVSVSRDEYEILQNLLAALGIPFIIAPR